MTDRVRTTVSAVAAAVIIGVVGHASRAAAQPLGTISWQIQPYCNVVTVAVTQAGGVYRLDGTDYQCGALRYASVVGTAFLNPDGSVGLAFTVVTTPGATPLGVEATVAFPSLVGTWRDSAGRAGAFVPTSGPGFGTQPRPVASVQFRAQGHAAQSIPDQSNTPVTGWSVVYNDGGGTYAPATGTYTVPLTGLYSVIASVYWEPLTTDQGYGLSIIRNDDLSAPLATVFGGVSSSTATNGSVPEVSTVARLNAGDTLRVYVFQGSGGSHSILATPSASTFTVVSIR
jgi:hypothetical protein